ncbi:MAG: ABC transporter ATP-binding protein [Oscillospiraceae bacterium]|nr:ABC transporter ATP-binding protein [Oscillospiraceae bacterium]MBR3084508.1 ABC transporter ATP-binding protein [Oscillospiraceae bacterium]MBR6096418.1 ABC transporter ATP-binding protein [Oscillospiraceae bacterium]
MIEAKNLTKRFDGFAALDGLTLTVPTGAVYGLVGPNGSGKSTLLRHVTGIYRQDAGELLVDGAPVWENPAVKARMGYIPDDVYYNVQSTVEDMRRFYRGVYPGFDQGRFEKLGKLFELPLKKPIRSMSKGQQKQAAFWLQMSLNPEIFVLDEPVDGLDPVMRRQVWSVLMADAAERGITVLVSSHNLRELEDVCDHVGILERGKLLLERSLSELQENLVKLQLALPDERPLPEDLNILHRSAAGRLQTLIVRGRREAVMERLQALQPLFLEAAPLNLEEIFIYELGGTEYEVQDILH